ncbi:MAG: hypothetical protein EAY81_09410 [Bacteroidetes bacterium]|nr:MAG: hypothetical protein EAY81_09410 [Bacteroidota bacterium]TAF43107.1 MAG: hypothetical protein EAZ64_09550 [Sphingobacteriales bacterium]
MGYKLNNKDFKGIFGIDVTTGSNTFLAFPKRKESLNKNWAELNGLEIDLQEPFFESREFKLNCCLNVVNLGNATAAKTEYWNKYNGLFTELSGLGTHQLFVEDLGKTFYVYYKEQSNFQKLTSFSSGKIAVTFDLVFGETNPSDNMDAVYLVDEQDRYLIA